MSQLRRYDIKENRSVNSHIICVVHGHSDAGPFSEAVDHVEHLLEVNNHRESLEEVL